MDIIDQYVREQMNRDAARVEDEIRMWMRMGYTIEELQMVIYCSGMDRRCEVVPRSIVE